MVAPFSGQAFADEKLTHVREWASLWAKEHGRAPKIISIFPYEDVASARYTELKKQDALQAGIYYVPRPLSLKDERSRWISEVLEASADENVEGVLIQKPSAKAFSRITSLEAEALPEWWAPLVESLSVEKDLDGLSPTTMFRLESTAERVEKNQDAALDTLESFLLPATAQAVIDIALRSVQSDVDRLRQMSAAVIGRSVIVGRPAAAGLRILGLPVKLLSSQADLATELQNVQLIITATGKSELIQPEWLSAGATLIDVGAPKPEFAPGCAEKARFWTPVPRGVGPVTRACLLENLQKLQSISV
jgi:methylenetetrahydrofolate dehydrogenase (NADP+)/methenyltetrahydrofolate cyclohydrolase